MTKTLTQLFVHLIVPTNIFFALAGVAGGLWYSYYKETDFIQWVLILAQGMMLFKVFTIRIKAPIFSRPVQLYTQTMTLFLLCFLFALTLPPALGALSGAIYVRNEASLFVWYKYLLNRSDLSQTTVFNNIAFSLINAVLVAMISWRLLFRSKIRLESNVRTYD